MWDLDHSASSETGSEVGWASKDPAEMLRVHEVVSLVLQALLNLSSRLGESLDDLLDVVALLHRHNSHLIFLVDPDEEVLVVVVEDTSGIGPVAAAAGGKEESGIGFLEEVSGVSEGLLFFVGHTVGHGGVRSRASKWEVVTSKIASH